MYILKFSRRDKKVDVLEERLKEMSLAFKLETLSSGKPMILTEGKKEIVGYENINIHLDALKKELHNWYYCNC